MSKRNAPVAVFAFNRPEPLSLVLERIAKADSVASRDIIIYIDGPRNARDVPKIAETVNVINSFAKTVLPNIIIRQREVNLGCQNNISSAITEVVAAYGKVVVVEDDVLISRHFLRYMDEALEMYEHDQRIWGINGHQCPYMRLPRTYKDDIYLSPRNLCTGWGTWDDRWNKVDMDITDWKAFISSKKNVERLILAGCDLMRLLSLHYDRKLNSWALPCTYYMVKHGLYMVEPRYSLTKNVGFGIDSVHNPKLEMAWLHQKYYNFHPDLDINIKPSSEVLDKFRYVFNDNRILHRITRKLYRLFMGLTDEHNTPIDL